jgi:hypothetical protein
MGCFNKTGFFSHLPITYGDEIVLFVCVDTLNGDVKRDSTPIDVTSNGLTPALMPFFGKYNDYGSIEAVVEDANYKFFTEKIGMSLEDFCNIMHDQGGMTINSMTKYIEDIKSGDKSENKYHYETVEDLEKGIKLLKTIFGFEVKKHEFPIISEKEKEHAEELNKIAEEMYQRELNEYNNASIAVIMEHKSVYDKMVEVGKENYLKGWCWHHPVSPEEAFDFTLKVIKENDGKLENNNPLTLGVNSMSLIDLDIEGVDMTDVRKNMYLFLGNHCIMHCTVYVDPFDLCFYNGLGAGIEPMKELTVNFVYFLRTFISTCTAFNFSPYHNQEVAYDKLIPVFEEILETLKRQAHKYDDEE